MMKRLLFALLFICGVQLSNYAQLSGYYVQGFESPTFPPPGWSVTNINGPTYTWVRSTAQSHASTASAFIRYDAVAGGGLDWMVTPKFNVTAATDSLVFWMRLQFAGYQPDSLCIKVSTTDSLPASFPATSILGLREGTNYPTNNTTWYRYAISLSAYVGQNIFIGFKHFNVDGDGLYIDDVTIGTKPANEVLPLAITNPNFMSTAAQTPAGTVFNNGTATQTFNTTMEINPGGYTSTQNVAGLVSGATVPVSFGSWVPPGPGTYTMKMFTQLAGDQNVTNDTITKTIQVLQQFPNYGWSSETALPGGRWASGAAFTKTCVSNTDTAYLYFIGGGDGTFNTTGVCYKYNLTTDVYQTIADIPGPRLQVHPLQANGKIYVAGGYSSGFTPANTMQIYDPATNAWSTGAIMPTAVGDYAAAVYNDSLLYYIAGYNGSADVNLVQIYNVNTNTWSAGTTKTGVATAGGRMGIANNQIVYVGGYSQTLAATQDDAVLGVIDMVNPTIIIWSSLGNSPLGNTGRLAGGTSIKNNDGRIYFTGGDPNGAGTSAINSTFAYNTLTSAWELGPNKITSVSNITTFASIIDNDSIYMVVMGGYNGSAVVATNEWINLGPVDLPYASNDVVSCGTDTVSLNAYNGISYSWTPAAGVSDPSIANPTAIVTATDTFTVTINPKYGCPVNEDVIVTINPFPVIDSYTDIQPLCNGDANGSIQVNTTGSPLDYSWSNGDLDDIADNISSGTYDVTVTNSSTGCTTTGTHFLAEPVVLSVSGISSTSVLCNGDSTATIDITVSGGTVGYAYSWSNSAITQDLNNIPAGTYDLTVTDTNGCIDNSFSATITEPATLNIVGSPSDLNCNGDADGAIDVTVNGGTPGFDYSWSNSAVTEDLTGLSGGSYTLTVTDTNGCISTYSATIIEPTALSANSANVVVTGCTGSLTATPSGGTPSYTYLWSDPGAQTTQTATGLCGGTYTCTVTDDNGCTTTVVATVTDNTGIDENTISNMNIYPNPFADYFTLSVQMITDQDVELLLYSLDGKMVYSSKMLINAGTQSIVVNPGEIAKGVYTVMLLNNNGIIGKTNVIKQ